MRSGGEREGDGGRGLTALAMATVAASMGISVATVAVPALSRSFGATMAGASWVMLAYLLAVTVVIVPGGRLGDLIGHRRTLLAGLAVFALASVLCAVAPTLQALVVMRAVQGAGGALLMAAPLAIARATVPAARLGAAFGALGAMSAVGTALGPSVGGALIGWLGWPAPFAALALVALGTMAAALRTLPRDPTPVALTAQRLDAPGALALSAALLAFALAFAGGASALSVHPGWLLGAAALGFAVFLAIERRAAAPMAPLHVFRDRALAAGLAMNLLVCAGLMATLVVGPIYLAFGLGLDEARVGLTMAAGPAIAAMAGAPAGRLADRLGTARAVRLGLVVVTAGFIGLATLPGLLGVAGYLAAMAVLTPAFQLFLAANTAATMTAANEDRRGLVGGLLGLSRNLGFVAGASLMGALFAVASGGGGVAALPPPDIARAFAITFLAPACVTLLAMLLGRRRGA